jgi:hypothetical protein
MNLALFPKIDLLVADHVLGYELVRLGYMEKFLEPPTLKKIKEHKAKRKGVLALVPKGAEDNPPDPGVTLDSIASNTVAPAPKFTLDMMLAFNAIVPQINREGLLFSLRQYTVDGQTVWDARFGDFSFVSRITAVAICIAALKVAELDFEAEHLSLQDFQ